MGDRDRTCPRWTGRPRTSPCARSPRGPSRCAAGIQIVEGRNFTPGLDEVIVGRKLSAPHAGLRASGSRSSTSGSDFKIVGMFDSEGGAFESEIWGDYDTFGAMFQRGPGANSLVVRMKDAAGIPELDRWIRAQPQMQLQAVSERKYYEDQAGPLAAILRNLATFVAVHHGSGRRLRGHEHHVRDRGRAHARDRHAARPGLLAQRHPLLVRAGVRLPGPARGRPRRACSPSP